MLVFHARQILDACYAFGQFGIVDEHDGNVVFNAESGTAARAYKRVAFKAQFGFPHGADENIEKLFVDHGSFRLCLTKDTAPPRKIKGAAKRRLCNKG